LHDSTTDKAKAQWQVKLQKFGYALNQEGTYRDPDISQ
jgi:hypothetical protein